MRDVRRVVRTCQTNGVERVQVVVFEGLPKQTEREGLTVVHRRLGRIVSYDTVDDDRHLAVGEPSPGEQAGLGLRGRRGEEEEGGDSDGEGDEAVDAMSQ